MSRIAAIDWGQARIGVAISDEMRLIARALETIQAEKSMAGMAKQVVAALKEYSIGEIVVGLPLKMDGSHGLQADEVDHFIEELIKVTDVPIKKWDERLTSVQADRCMREGNLSRKKRAKKVDSIAAILILQSYLDTQ